MSEGKPRNTTLSDDNSGPATSGTLKVDIRGKVVLITGGARGIGEALAYRFARENYNIVLTWLNDEAQSEKVVTEAKRLGALDVTAFRLDVTNPSSIDECIKSAVARFGNIDILINNAGVLTHKFLSEQSLEEIRQQLRVNLEGLILMTQACLPHLHHSVINIASLSGLRGLKRQSVYAASKFGVRGFTQSLARECPNLRVYAINPGMTSTRMTGFQGESPENVAEVIYRAVSGQIHPPSGSDINIQDYIGPRSSAIHRLVRRILKA